MTTKLKLLIVAKQLLCRKKGLTVVLALICEMCGVTWVANESNGLIYVISIFWLRVWLLLFQSVPVWLHLIACEISGHLCGPIKNLPVWLGLCGPKYVPVWLDLCGSQILHLCGYNPVTLGG